jgi:integrase
LLLRTGACLSAALTLNDGDLGIAAGTAATLREIMGGGTMQVFLRSKLVELLRVAVAGRRSGPVFAGRDGGHLTSRHVQRRFEEWLAKAGVRGRYSPHSLRHTFAMQLYSKTADVLLVQAALGHRAISSTMVYARASAEQVRAAVVG